MDSLTSAVLRFEGKLAVKAASRKEQELARKLQGLFSQAKEEAVRKLRSQGANGVIQRRITLAKLDAALGTAAGLIHQSVIEAAEGAPLPPELLREQAFTASQATLQRVRGDVMDVMARAWVDGLGIDAAAALVEEAFTGLETHEAARIARTEINSAQSNSRMAKMAAAGIDYIQWWTATDVRVRDSHAAQHGLIVKRGDAFPNGLKHPHDRSGPIEEWINCRCRPLPFRMPVMMAPPPGKVAFRESELIRVAA